MQTIASAFIFSEQHCKDGVEFLNHKDKVKTFWNIVKTETGRKTEKEGITYNGLPIGDQQAIASIFNSYFLSIADEIIATNTNKRNIKPNSVDQVRNIFQNTRPHYPRIDFR
jgi:hypothetical protein